MTIEGLEGYEALLKALVRLHGTPLGYVQLPVVNGVAQRQPSAKLSWINSALRLSASSSEMS